MQSEGAQRPVYIINRHKIANDIYEINKILRARWLET